MISSVELRQAGIVVLYAFEEEQGAEIDWVPFKRGRCIGTECKRADAPVLKPLMRIALADLNLDELLVVYPGGKRYSLARNSYSSSPSPRRMTNILESHI